MSLFKISLDSRSGAVNKALGNYMCDQGGSGLAPREVKDNSICISTVHG